MPGEAVLLFVLYPLVVGSLETGLVVRLLSKKGRRWFRSLDADGCTSVVWGSWILTGVLGGVWFALLVNSSM
jgi:hypothetical protein